MVLVSKITHRLDLCLQLIDTSVSKTITGGVRVKINGKDFIPRKDADGNFIFLELEQPRQDFELEITANGYETKTIQVNYGELDEALPYIKTHMLPGEKYFPEFPCFTLKGVLTGIIELDAVKIVQNPCLIKEYDVRKRLLTVFNPYKLLFDSVYYAAVAAEDEEYEPFIIEKNVSETLLKIKEPLEKPENAYQNRIIAARVIGKTEKNNYLLRVRKESGKAKWLVRFVTKKGEFFQTTDFSNEEQLVLKEKKGVGGH
ncbi:MAG: hypothetical protein FWG44_02260 [Oscillospiraceae bacterium]|nr:hypothetical protein [Oscillospiraceae bacterium]